MRYLALGDSISIDYYTGVAGGGAASQLARRLGVHGRDFVDLTKDGNVTSGVLSDLAGVSGTADVVTLTVGGNDLLMGRSSSEIVAAIGEIAYRLAHVGDAVILNTVYDPTDGDDDVAREALALRPELRAEFDAVNAGIGDVAARHDFLLADLEQLFHGHGLRSSEPWYVNLIEPNLAGASAIAACWHELLTERGVV